MMDCHYPKFRKELELDGKVKWTIDRYTETNQISSPKKRGLPKNTTEVNKFKVNFSNIRKVYSKKKRRNI